MSDNTREMITISGGDFTRINNDVNGNPRYVIHFTELLNKNDSWDMDNIGGSINDYYLRALDNAKKIGGKKFHNKQYGGGIVFQSYSLPETIKAIEGVINENN